ncbi:transposase [Oleiphilus sp. HI0081]|nr:transposase [Oleiphilus sp. HI0072]KZZ11307.1 transposase [Oleiphilus sp. HI0078]KZZ20853.1 transposase [Oleiphilus sp. HI0081]
MPRKPRMYMAGVPCHVIQRGNNREACFFSDQDNQFYLECLQEACERYDVSCHAYVLMTNHTHLLLTPSCPDGVSKVMQSLGRRYVQYVNKTYRRCGTLWESRHKASLIDAEGYLLKCYRYIELNPVMANMVEHPADYRWSSYRCNAYGERSPLISAHEVYAQLAHDTQSRLVRYRELFNVALSKGVIHEIRTSASFSMPLGDDRFKAQIEENLKRSIGYSKIGRPLKCE